MTAMEIMTCVTLIYTAIVLLVQHNGRRRLQSKDTITTAFIIGDILFTGLTIGLISIMARSGVPSHCGGLTPYKPPSSDHDSSDEYDDDFGVPHWYTTEGFSSGGSEKGKMDHFCALERGYYFISIAIIFSYMATVTMGVLRIFESIYQKRLDDQLATSSELIRLESKVSRTQRSSLVRQSSNPPSPLQEGVTSPSPRSPRSFTSRHSFRDQVGPRRSAMPVSPLTISPATTVDPAREGLLIDQHASDNVENAAEAAMVTDGYRNPRHATMSVPPPYTPGESSRFMTGHTDESNDMRLSDYVKGQTRAQNMKDAGVQ
ncbi:hypothetical protein JX265_001347 [Neoarthrinium moseri]|uniref:Uncharacterized protein n=1 Tax=Neoarthrinium moseri TaxID=1658444 RepID=A0A9Q0ART3_9PEZI|nr:uncharacterized protein JN550_004115 [Neoarthrinium moseri]KAI1842039.1 hypothetical protein JX266_011794 [Neoarthrinium moseri]KAI1872396.1 hypothetical protein JN550_004115 [Neoarthrinium moseri]KAI1881107.1 hypothetical protein JX265_001347 [Neoarthrinium moseri]